MNLVLNRKEIVKITRCKSYNFVSFIQKISVPFSFPRDSCISRKCHESSSCSSRFLPRLYCLLILPQKNFMASLFFHLLWWAWDKLHQAVLKYPILLIQEKREVAISLYDCSFLAPACLPASFWLITLKVSFLPAPVQVVSRNDIVTHRSNNFEKCNQEVK